MLGKILRSSVLCKEEKKKKKKKEKKRRGREAKHRTLGKPSYHKPR
jgi:hypothetical protein